MDGGRAQVRVCITVLTVDRQAASDFAVVADKSAAEIVPATRTPTLWDHRFARLPANEPARECPSGQSLASPSSNSNHFWRL